MSEHDTSLPVPDAHSPREAAALERLERTRGSRLVPQLAPNGDGTVGWARMGSADLLQAALLQTTGDTCQASAEALITHVGNSLGNRDDVDMINATVATLNSLQPETPLEGLLAGQMVAVHNLAMRCVRRAANAPDTDNADRAVNQAAKLMRVFCQQTETLQKLRTKGQQTIQVQHVHVNDGGQAIVGNVQQGGGGSRG